MDQEVLQDLYNRAVSKGYSKSIEEFSTLISSDQEVLEDNYNYVKQQGYQKPIEDFQVLVGVKKKKIRYYHRKMVYRRNLQLYSQLKRLVSLTTLPLFQVEKKEATLLIL